ncbi:MAG: hypothetical protein Q9226_007677 [Calogaya cf. arnoldii]
MAALPATSLDLARPISWPPSQYWENGDWWSSFALRVGNPAQVVRVLLSTAGQATWVVSDQSCTPDELNTCEKDSGGLFKSNVSQTWKELGFYSLGLETNLGPSDNATFGLETVGLDYSNATGGPLLSNQVVAALSGSQYSLGVFGLGRQPTDLNNFTNPRPSFLTTLYSQGYIPSLSWSYTAGARYRNKGVFGSLTLGGYDTARLLPNNVSFDLAPDISRDLVVGLQGVISSESNGSQHLLLPSPHLTFIDSTIPYLYMPLEACILFEQALGLKWNESEQLYIVDEELHRDLLMRKPTFTFELGNSLTGGPTVDIILPYSSFDLSFKPTYDSEPVRYFPLQRAANKSQLTLGRSFLQEAYLITDYERGNFSVSQCTFEEPMTQNILPILPSGSQETVPQPTNSQQQASSSEGRHGRGFHFAIAVIVGSVLGLLFLLCISYGLYLRCFRRRKNRASGPELSECSSAKVPQMFTNNDDSPKALQSTSSFQSDIEGSKNGGIVIQEIDTNDWSFTREIPDSGRTELPENCKVFELPQSVSPEPIHRRPESLVTLQPSPSRKRRWGLHFSTDGLFSTGSVIKCWMGLTELHAPPKEAATGAETSSKVFRSGNSYLNRSLPPTPISESPMRLSYHIWTKVAERRNEKQHGYPSPLMAPDDRYKHRQGFF